jgi:hypothetical protein
MHGPTCIFWASLTPFSLKDGAIHRATFLEIYTQADGTPALTPENTDQIYREYCLGASRSGPCGGRDQWAVGPQRAGALCCPWSASPR